MNKTQFLIIIFALYSNSGFAINTVATGFKVLNGSNVQITAHSVCRDVANNSGTDQFVATKTSTEWNNFLASPPAGLTLSSCGPTPPSSLSLSHTNNNRYFYISWTGGSSVRTCSIQYFQNNSSWNTISSGLNCDSNVTSSIVYFPSFDYWTNNFNTSGVPIRLVRDSDSSVLHSFTQQPSCFFQGPSSSSTPLIDENCDGRWDDSSSSSGTVALAQLNFGSAYSCSLPGGSTLSSLVFHSFPDHGYTNTSSSCTPVPPSGGTANRVLFSASGVVPSVSDHGTDLTTVGCQASTAVANASWYVYQARSSWFKADCNYTTTSYN